MTANGNKVGYFARRSEIILVLIILAAVAAVYLNALGAEFVYDDGMYITKNSQIRHLSNFWSIPWNRYLTFLTFALNYAISGYTAFDFRLVNVLIHAVNAVLVFYLVKLTFKAVSEERAGGGFDAGVLPAFGAALIFAVHPIEIQAVTYLTQRFVSLATLFYLLSLAFYVKYRLKQGDEDGRQASRLFYVLSFAAAVLAQLSKEISFTLSAVIALYEFTFFKGIAGGYNLKKRIYALLPFALVFLIIPLTLLVPDDTTIAGKIRAEQVRELMVFSRYEYLVTQFRVIVTYLRLLVYPANQQLLYDYPIFKSILVPQVMASFVFLCTLFFGAVYLLVRSVKRRDVCGRFVAFGVLWFFITISVESSIVPIRHVIFEHRTYLPSVGLFTAFTVLLFYLFGRFGAMSKEFAKSSYVALFVVVLITTILGWATVRRNDVWQTNKSLWLDTTEKAPNMAEGFANAAYAYRSGKQFDKALEYYMMAASRSSAEDFYQYPDLMAGVLISLGRYDEAVKLSSQIIELYPDKGVLYLNRGVAYYKLGMKGEALKEYLTSIERQPDLIVAYKNAVISLYEMGRLDEAAAYAEKALAADPFSEEILLNYARILDAKGDHNGADAKYAMALRVNPAIDPVKIRGQEKYSNMP